MAVTIDTGVGTTASPNQASLKVDMRKAIAYLEPETAQFTTMLMHPKFEQDRAQSFKKQWLNARILPRNTALAVSLSAGDTALTVTTSEGAYFKVGDIIKVTLTGEAMRVTTVGASAVTVVRAVGTVAATSSVSGAAVVIVNGSNEQAATLPTRMVTEDTDDYNYTTIHRDSYGWAETALATQWYGGPRDAKSRKETGISHKRNIEMANFFGARSYSAGSTGPRHTTGGLIEYIGSSQVTDAAGAFDKGELQDWLRGLLTYGNRNSKVIFAAPLVAQVFGEYLQDNWVRATPSDKIWGVNVDFVVSSAFAGAKIPVVVKGDWEQFGTGTSGQYGSIAFGVDMGNVAYSPLRDTALLPNRQAPDADEQSAEFLTEATLVVQRPETHALLKNVTGPS